MSEENIDQEPPPQPPLTEPAQTEAGKKQAGNKRKAPAFEAEKPRKARKQYAKRAPCWEHFLQRDGILTMSYCKYCGAGISCDSKTVGTSPMNGHLKICKAYKDWDEKDKQQVLSGDNKGNLKVIKYDPHLFRKSINEMVVVNELPFSFVESEGWKRFCFNLFPMYKTVTKKTCSKDIVGMYLEEKAALKKLFADEKQRVSLTTDIWTSPTTSYNYMVVTGHWINGNWEMQKRILSFKVITDHKGETIARQLLDCIDDWGIEKVFTVTVDNARNNDKALSVFKNELRLRGGDCLVGDGQFLHMRCCAHILNLVVSDGLKKVQGTVVAVRNAVKYVRSSFTRLRSFAMRCDNGKLCRGSLPLDVVTRWNSTYLMLSSALKLRVAFEKMKDEDKLYCDYFNEEDEKTRLKRVGPPAALEWEEVSRLVKFLKIFYKATLVFSASKYVSSSVCYNEIVNVERALMAKCVSSDEDTRKQAHAMRDKFEKYWDGLKNMNPLVIIASVFDPRNKMQFSSLCFDQLYGRDTVERNHLSDKVSIAMNMLYAEYSSRLTKPAAIEATAEAEAKIGMEEFSDEDDDCERIESLYSKMVQFGVNDDSGNELQSYLAEKPELRVENRLGMTYDVLSWWRYNSSKFPILSEFARDVLASQASSVASESAFSTSGRVLDPYRSSLTPYMVEVLICTQQWLRCSFKSEADVANLVQMLEEVEFFESLDSRNAIAPPP